MNCVLAVNSFHVLLQIQINAVNCDCFEIYFSNKIGRWFKYIISEEFHLFVCFLFVCFFLDCMRIVSFHRGLLKMSQVSIWWKIYLAKVWHIYVVYFPVLNGLHGIVFNLEWRYIYLPGGVTFAGLTYHVWRSQLPPKLIVTMPIVIIPRS